MATQTKTLLSTSLAAPVAASAVALQLSEQLPDKSYSNAVQLLTTADYKAVAACLSSSFENDAAIKYPLNVPDAAHWPPEQRQSLYVRAFECVVYAHILRGEVVGVPSATTPGSWDAVALWLPPGRNFDDFFTQVRSGLWCLRWSYSPQGRTRFYDEFLPLLSRSKAEVLKERDDDAWYLVYLGTRPEARGRGLARQLVRHGTAQADAACQPTYLESSNDANVAYYQRLGFTIKKTIALDEGTRPKLDLMVREPNAAKV